MKSWMKKFAAMAVAAISVSAGAAPGAGAMDWTGTQSAGAFVGFDQYGTPSVPLAPRQVEGLSYLYGLNSRWRVGGELGLQLVTAGSSPSSTDLGFSIAPMTQYDLISKPAGSLYAVGRLLNYSVENAAVSPGSATIWSLGIVDLGLGMEAVINHDFSVYFEGDVVRFGMTNGGGATASDIGLFAFPGVRLGMRMNFGGSAKASAPAS